MKFAKRAKRLTLLMAAGAILLVGWVLNASQMYWMGGVLLALPLASRLMSLLEHRGLQVEREMPHTAHQGEVVEVRLRARNLLVIPKLQLALRDALPLGLSTPDPEPVPVDLPSRGSDEAVYPLVLGRRGLHTLPGVEVHSQDILGLWPLETLYPLVSQVLVYPRIVPLPAWAFPPEVGGGQAPLQAAHRHGESAGFFGVREYRPGDPLRHIHWRTAARYGRLAVVEWEAEESVDAVLALETLRGSDLRLREGTTLDLAAGLAASLARIILDAGDSVRLIAPGTTEWRAGSERGAEALGSILEILARVSATSDTSLATELRHLAAQLPSGSLVCWLTANPSTELLATVSFLRDVRLRPVIYALSGTSRGRPGTPDPWSAVAAELDAAGVTVIRVSPEDELVTQLLA